MQSCFIQRIETVFLGAYISRQLSMYPKMNLKGRIADSSITSTDWQLVSI